MKYIQCLLVKYVSEPTGMLKTVSWLPEKFVTKRRVLKLQLEDGSWSEDWMIQETYGSNEEVFILAHERDFARQRKASDI